MMDKAKQQEIKYLLGCYLGDLDYWCNTMDVGEINCVTAGTPEFECIEDAKAHRDMVEALLNELEQ